MAVTVSAMRSGCHAARLAGVALAVLLWTGVARGQAITDVMTLPDVADVQRLVVTQDGSFHLIATLREQADPVLISSRLPRRRVAMPGVDPARVAVIEVKGRGLVVTWVVDDLVHQVSSATGAALPSRPIPAMAKGHRTQVDVTPGSAGGLLFVAKPYDSPISDVAVLDPRGRAIPIDAALFATAKGVAFAQDNAYLVVDEPEGKDWHYSLKRKKRMPESSRGLPQVEFTWQMAPFEASVDNAWVTRSRPFGELQVRDYRKQDRTVWSLSPYRGPFAVLRDAILIVREVDDVWTVQRIDFEGGLSAWTAMRHRALEQEARVAEARGQEEQERAAREAALQAERAREAERTAAAREAALEAERRRAASGSAPASGRESLDDAVRRVVAVAKGEGLTLETSRVGVSNSTHPLRLALRLRGNFSAVVLVDSRAVKTQLSVHAEQPSTSIALSYDQTEDQGWLMNGTSFHTDGESLGITIEGGGYTYGTSYPTALLLFSR